MQNKRAPSAAVLRDVTEQGAIQVPSISAPYSRIKSRHSNSFFPHFKNIYISSFIILLGIPLDRLMNSNMDNKIYCVVLICKIQDYNMENVFVFHVSNG